MKKLIIALTLCAFAVGCQSKKKTEETQTLPEAGASETSIDSSPMSFDPAGSDSGAIAGLQTIHFDFDKSSLTAEAKQILGQNAEWMKTNSKINLQIEGHCDNRGSIEYNLSLGERRAQSVKNYLVGLGISKGRLSVISYGEEKLLAQGDSEDVHYKNRRANFVPLQ